MSFFSGLTATGVEAFIARYWGKARDTAGGRWHPLAYHQADVAACALAIADVRLWMLDWMADHLGRPHGWDAPAIRRMIAVLGYAHDLGKHAVGFQAQACYAFRACTGRPAPAGVVAARGVLRHDALGLVAWTKGLRDAPSLPEAILGAVLGANDLEAWQPLASAAFGHHGHPTDPDATGVRSGVGSVMHRDDLAAACASCTTFRAIVGDFPQRVDAIGAALVSIPFAGLLQVADWMGSDRNRFDYAAAETPLATYWEGAQAVARQAVAELGLLPARPAPWSGVEPIVAPHPPTPMQVAAAETVIDGPFLAILEDTMGSGKTEAAIALAARAMASGLAHGLFVGMPTTATADGQAARQARLRRIIFADDMAPPSFAIAHGRSDPRRWPTDPDGAPLPGFWIADERRLRLLADLCVGTVDQALLGVMATEFSAVRRFALLGKVLVIDEVHAYDDYTLRLVEDLVREHAALGGSVVLLSATLTAASKQRLLAAFRGGAAGSEAGFAAATDPAAPYPALTMVLAAGARTIAVGRAPMAPPDKSIEVVHTSADAEAALLGMAERGGCAAWVRLTVDDAIGSAVALAARHADVTALHSRMPAAQRNAIEAALRARFGKGKEGEATARGGGIVVATSVIAASLDIDFDLVVVDLRGMDEVLQALGRGRRHRRALDGRVLPSGSADLRPPAPMLVLAPDPDSVVDDAWLRRMVGWGGAKVVGNAALAWRTVALLGAVGYLHYGAERSLMEAAASASAVSTPPLLAASDDQAEAAALCRRSMARSMQDHALRATTGYVSSGLEPADDEVVETRLDEVGAVEVLLVDGAEGCRPLWGGNHEGSDGRIRIPTHRFAEGGLARAREIASRAGLPRGTLAVPMRKEGDFWTHSGEVVCAAVVDPRWGLCWQIDDSAMPSRRHTPAV